MTGDQDFRLQLLGYSLTTVEIAYYLPDHPSLGRVRQGGVISAVAVGHRQAALAVMCRG